MVIPFSGHSVFCKRFGVLLAIASAGLLLVLFLLPPGLQKFRFKILADLDIAERRKPQDGKIKFTTSAGKAIELRVATVPTADGNEDVVLRVLAAGKPLLDTCVGEAQNLMDREILEFLGDTGAAPER